MSLIAEKYDSTKTGMEINLSKFYKLAKDHFQITVKNDTDPINNIKESIRFFSLDVPQEIKEIFIPYADAPLFWIYESSVLNQIEEFMRFNINRMDSANVNKQIKENYTKWATTKLKSEKEYYSTTTINFIERDLNKHNFFKYILKAIILTYQNSFYNPIKAVELLKSAGEIINTLRMNEQNKTELKYIIGLYKGFVHLKENAYDLANAAFKECLDLKHHGNTAKLYMALTEVNLGHNDLALFYLNEIFNYDVYRLAVALKTNNSGMFSYFFRNAFFYNVFYEKDFQKCLGEIETLLVAQKGIDYSLIHKCENVLQTIKSKNLDEYFDEEIKKSLAFVEKMLTSYSKVSNTIMYAAFPEFGKKINAIVNSIKAKVKTKYYSEVKEKLSVLSDMLNENKDAERHLEEELNLFKERNKTDLRDSINRINSDYENEAMLFEEKINDLPKSDRYNPGASMSSYMTYNIIVAFLVFFIGGVSSYNNSVASNGNEYNSILTYILISATKWGAISFFLGLIISIIFTGIIVVERFDVKSKLQRRLIHLKLEKESMINDANEKASTKEKIMNDNINSSLAYHRKKGEDLKQEITTTEKALIAEAEEKIKAFVSDLPDCSK